MIIGNPLTLGGGSAGKLGTKNATENRTYTALDDGLDGYSAVTVDVQPNLITKVIREDGVYPAVGDAADGYSLVTVSVTPADPANGQKF